MLLLGLCMYCASTCRGELVGQPTHTPVRPVSCRQYKYQKRTLDATLSLGERVQAFMLSMYGREEATRIFDAIVTGSQPNSSVETSQAPSQNIEIIDLECAEKHDAAARNIVPYGFWTRFFREEMHQPTTNQRRKAAFKSLRWCLLRKEAGAVTHVGMRASRAGGSCRSDGGRFNAEKARGFAFVMLQFFVDQVQRLMSRADSCFLLAEARNMRDYLLAHGWPLASLPKLIGNAGIQWFRRWRKRYGIVRKVLGMKLKVPWKKVKSRVRVFLGNIFRLAALWELCHPGTPMRFMSLDQKPAWWNATGLLPSLAQKGRRSPTVLFNGLH